jgi:1-phosphofructokinase
MIHLVSLNPSLDIRFKVREPSRGKVGLILEEAVEAGGKALNLARFLKKGRVPSRVWLGTGGGGGPTHLLYRSLLSQEGFSARFLSAKAPIRFNLVLEEGGAAHKYNHPGFELDLASFGGLHSAVRKGDLLALTGRLSQGMNPALYASWIRSFNRKGVRTVVDTSGKALWEALKAGPGFLKVNLFELAEALGRRFSGLGQVGKVLPDLFHMGLSHGAVTNGADGALVWCGPEAYLVSSSRKVRGFVVGAGDAFLAGYLKGVVAKLPFPECARLACASGTVVAREGIMGFEVKAVSKMLKSVKVKRF